MYDPPFPRYRNSGCLSRVEKLIWYQCSLFPQIKKLNITLCGTQWNNLYATKTRNQELLWSQNLKYTAFYNEIYKWNVCNADCHVCLVPNGLNKDCITVISCMLYYKMCSLCTDNDLLVSSIWEGVASWPVWTGTWPPINALSLQCLFNVSGVSTHWTLLEYH